MSAVTTHVLDTASGTPASGICVRLEGLGNTGWTDLSNTTTNLEGRARLLEDAAPGEYRLTFFLGVEAFYPEIAIHFKVRDARHHHIPLLLSPFGYSTYRGS